jgi:quinol monooxygenase YgiN
MSSNGGEHLRSYGREVNGPTCDIGKTHAGEFEQLSVVLINVFTVAPENQQQLIDILTAATRGAVDQEPGFISATLHRSLDGSKVTMYARWRDAEAYAAMRRKPGRPFLAQALQIATFEPGMYEIVETFLPPSADTFAPKSA